MDVYEPSKSTKQLEKDDEVEGREHDTINFVDLSRNTPEVYPAISPGHADTCSYLELCPLEIFGFNDLSSANGNAEGVCENASTSLSRVHETGAGDTPPIRTQLPEEIPGAPSDPAPHQSGRKTVLAVAIVPPDDTAVSAAERTGFVRPVNNKMSVEAEQRMQSLQDLSKWTIHNFANLDINKDGTLTLSEIAKRVGDSQFAQGANAAPLLALAREYLADVPRTRLNY